MSIAQRAFHRTPKNLGVVLVVDGSVALIVKLGW